MSLILPFKALRPSIDKASDVIAPPYDVLDSGEAREMAKDKPYSFLHISKPEIDLEEEINFNDESVYKKGADNLKNFIEDGILYQDKKECLYLYEITLDNKTQTGFGCIASIEAYNKNIIKLVQPVFGDGGRAPYSVWRFPPFNPLRSAKMRILKPALKTLWKCP